MPAPVTKPDTRGNSSLARAIADRGAGALPIEPYKLVQLLEDEITEDKVMTYCKRCKSLGDVRCTHETPWKKAIYCALQKRLEECRGKAVFSKSEEGEQEFMLDFVWLEKDNVEDYQQAFMGVECEWEGSLKEVARDFRKPLFFKAPLKLLIFWCPAKNEKKVQEMLCGCLKKFKQHAKDEYYLFIEFYKERNGSKKQKSWTQKSFRIGHDGTVSDVVILARGP